MTVGLGVAVEEVGGRLVVTLDGELDVAGAPELRQRLVELVAAGARDLVVDLDGVTSVDDVGLGVLVGGAWRVRSRGGTFAVVCGAGRVRDVLAVTGLDRAVDVHGSVTDAVTSSTA